MSLHYIDIHLRPDPEFPAHQLLSALYAKLHRALVELNATTLCVSFPGYALRPIGLGSHLRIIGPTSDLAALMALPWLAGMRDHLQVLPALPVPDTATHRRLMRVQAKSNPERLRRRQMKRHGISAEEAQSRVSDSAAEQLRLPFLQMRSASTGQSFRLFLSMVEVPSALNEGEFNSFGLSASRTAPWF